MCAPTFTATEIYTFKSCLSPALKFGALPPASVRGDFSEVDMSEYKQTPWEATYSDLEGDVKRWYVCEQDGNPVCRIIDLEEPKQGAISDKAEANMNLILAAPDLFESMQSLFANVYSALPDDPIAVNNRMKNALQKAMGISEIGKQEFRQILMKKGLEQDLFKMAEMFVSAYESHQITNTSTSKGDYAGLIYKVSKGCLERSGQEGA